MILNAQHHLKCNYVLLVKIEQCDQNCYNNPSTLNKKHLKMEGMKQNNNNNDNKMIQKLQNNQIQVIFLLDKLS